MRTKEPEESFFADLAKILIQTLNDDGVIGNGQPIKKAVLAPNTYYVANTQCTEVEQYLKSERLNQNVIRDTPGRGFLFDPKNATSKEYEHVIGTIKTDVVKWPNDSAYVSRDSVYHNKRDNTSSWPHQFDQMIYTLTVDSNI